MLYNLKDPLHREQLKTKIAMLLEKACAIIDVTEKKAKRSGQQNKYLHVILGYFALQTGDTLDWVKQKYFKTLVNAEIFIREKDDRWLGRVKFLRSSADLDSAEMSTAIERFRNWSSAEAGIYLPSDDENNKQDQEFLNILEIEVSRNQKYL